MVNLLGYSHTSEWRGWGSFPKKEKHFITWSTGWAIELQMGVLVRFLLPTQKKYDEANTSVLAYVPTPLVCGPPTVKGERNQGSHHRQTFPQMRARALFQP